MKTTTRVKKPPALKEKEIEQQILVWLNSHYHCFAFKVNTTGFYDSKRGVFRKNTSQFVMRGTSDIIGTWKGRFLAIEVKSLSGLKKWNNSPTEHELTQRAFLDQVNRKGGIGFVASSIQDVVTLLMSHPEGSKQCESKG